MVEATVVVFCSEALHTSILLFETNIEENQIRKNEKKNRINIHRKRIGVKNEVERKNIVEAKRVALRTVLYKFRFGKWYINFNERNYIESKKTYRNIFPRYEIFFV